MKKTIWKQYTCSEDDSHDFGYALRKEYWHQGIASEAGNAVIQLLKEEGIPYITATHDKNNPGSGAVMKRIGIKYCYSYKEQWQAGPGDALRCSAFSATYQIFVYMSFNLGAADKDKNNRVAK